jgi:hypothetical protein
MTKPRVGIFWSMPERMLHHSVPWDESKESIEGWINFGGHGEYWERFCQESGVDMEYTDFPRGRVMYHPKEKISRITGAKSLLKNKAFMDQVIKIFHVEKYDTVTDEHYESANLLLEDD